jgi:hypothetical protein
MGPCIVSIFQYTRISNKMQRYTVYLYLETALHVSGGIMHLRKTVTYDSILMTRDEKISSLYEEKQSCNGTSVAMMGRV